MHAAPLQCRILRDLVACFAALAIALAAAACGSSPAETTKADATVSVDAAPATDATSDAAADATQAVTSTCAPIPCGNGTCDPGESPASCPDCAGADPDCLEKPCAAEWQACTVKPGCLLLAQCLQDCGGTTACAAACAHGHGTEGVASVWEPLATCSANLGCGKNCGNGTCDPRETTGNCPADCNKSVAGNGVCEPGEGPPTLCNRDCGLVDYWGCMAGACPSEWSACQSDPACKATFACSQACALFDTKCVEACVIAAGPNTTPYYQDLISCPGKKACSPAIALPCGDGACISNEPAVCPRDCGPPVGVCGDGVCQPKESTKKCPADCKPAAPLLACATALCSATTAACNASASCQTALLCLDKCPAADFSQCSNACMAGMKTGDWWTLVVLMSCIKDFHCFPDPPAGCGDTICTPPETEASCPKDCFEPKVCGDNWCASTETKDTCPADCATCLDTGCGGKPNLVCCPVSGKPVCTTPSQCDAK